MVEVAKDYKYPLTWFWSIIIGEILLPFLVSIAVEIVSDPREAYNLRFIFLSPSFFLIGLLNDVPFILLAFLVRSLWHRPKDEKYKDFLRHKAGVIGAGVISISLILYINISIWISIVLLLPGFSTAVISYIFLPIYGIIALLVGYGLGRIVYKFVVKES